MLPASSERASERSPNGTMMHLWRGPRRNKLDDRQTGEGEYIPPPSLSPSFPLFVSIFSSSIKPRFRRRSERRQEVIARTCVLWQRRNLIAPKLIGFVIARGRMCRALSSLCLENDARLTFYAHFKPTDLRKYVLCTKPTTAYALFPYSVRHVRSSMCVV